MAACFSCFGASSKHLDEGDDFADDASFHSAGGASVASFATMASYRTAVSVVDVAFRSRGAAATTAPAAAAAVAGAASAAAAFTRRSTAALLRAFEAAAEAQQRTAGGSHAPGAVPSDPREVERAVEKLLDVLEEREAEEGGGDEEKELEDVDLGDAGSVAAAEPEQHGAAAVEPRKGFWARRFSKKKKSDKKASAAAVEEAGAVDADADDAASVATSIAPSISVSQHLAAEQEEGEDEEKELELVAAVGEDDGASSCASTPQVDAAPAATAPASAADGGVVVHVFGSELTDKGANAASSAASLPSKSAAPRTMSVRERAAAIERAA